MNALPTDMEALRQLCLAQSKALGEKTIALQEKETQLAQKNETLEQQNKTLEQQTQTLEQRRQHIETLEEYICFLQQKKYQSSSERHAAQMGLFDDELLPELNETDNNVTAIELSSDASATVNKSEKKKPGRRQLPEHLPRVQIFHELEPHDKHCTCGCELAAFGEVISEQLAVIPAHLYVIQHCRKKYHCRRCESTVKTAPLPPQPIPKSNASPELIAHSLVSKFLDGLPFYRQEKIWERGGGLRIPRATLANWSIKSAELTTPLINLLLEKQREGPVMHIDETPVQVLKEPGKSPTSGKRFWVTVGGPPDTPVYRFHYHPSRGSAVAKDLLVDYQGTVISDDWHIYARVCDELQLSHIACNDHARRKFKDAVKGHPKAKKKSGTTSSAANVTRAEQALQYYKQLYVIEREIKNLPPDVKLQVRQQKSLPIWARFKQWLDKHLNSVNPQSLLGKAIYYSIKLHDKLKAYCADGHLPISNEKAENAIRPFAIARKNFLFYDTPRGATASEKHYSLIMTAKANGLDPFYYLAYVFKQLPLAKTVEDIESLLPWNLTDTQTKVAFDFF